jgi:glycosyltransferase involved in cell wall biosynthesis
MSRSMRWVLPRITHHVAISLAVQDHMRHLGIPPERISLIPCAVDTGRFNSGVMPADLTALFGIPRGAPTVGIVGRVIPWKGQDMFLEVAARVLREIPAWAIIVGDASDGDQAFERQLRRRTAELGIAERVIFAGRRSDVPQLMKAMTVVLHLSRRPEPLGLVVAEALAVGTPVVGMNEGGVPDMLKDGESGFLRPREPAEPIAEAVKAILRDGEMRNRFGAAGAAFIASRFNGERCAKEYAEIYECLLESSSRGAETA